MDDGSASAETTATGGDSTGLDRKLIRLATYNIRSGRAGRLEIALRAMKQMNVDLGILTEAKLTDGIYTRYSSGYNVYATSARNHSQGGIALFYRDSPYWQVESIKRYGPNVLSFQLVTGGLRVAAVGAYVPPDDLSTLEFINRALDDLPQGQKPLLLGDLNMDLEDPRDDRAYSIAADMASFGFEDMLAHFRQRRGFRHGKTWMQHRNNEVLRSRCDYILGTDRRLFNKVCLRDPRLFSSDHLMVLGELWSSELRRNKSYLRGRQRFPLRAPKWGPQTRADALLQALNEAIPKPTRAERRARREWISEETWRLVDERSALRKVIGHDHAKARWLDRRVQQAFKADRKRQVEEAGKAIEAALSEGDLQGAWDRFKSWYRQASNRPSQPSRRDLRAVTQECIDLYTREVPPGAPIPVLVEPFSVSDETPSDEEIREAVRRLRRGKAPGPSGLRTDHLKKWLADAEDEDEPNSTLWDSLVALVQHVYETGELPSTIPWGIVVLLPKASGGYRGIGLLEVIWKVLSSIIDVRLKTAISFHDALHGFRAKRGTGTAIFEAKLFQQLASIQQVPVFEVFLDLKKAYDTLDRGRTLEILEQYGAGARMLRLLHQYWDQQQVVARQGGYHGDPFEVTRGLTQGDIPSPTIFNVVVDAIVRYWLSLVVDDGSKADGLGMMVQEWLVLFYADDGLIASRNHEWLQMAIECLSELFECMGLRTNTNKTEAMTCTPGYISSQVSDAAYKHQMEGTGLSYRERKRLRATCATCGKDLAAGSLAQHMRVQHGLTPDDGIGRADAPGCQPASYRMSFPKTVTKAACPVAGCPGTATSWSNLRRHFAHRHPDDTLTILEEGSTPLPKCERCGMHVPRQALSSGHLQSAGCRKGEARIRQCRALEDARQAKEVVLSI